jgi:disulfide bond formation protein DsbB
MKLQTYLTPTRWPYLAVFASLFALGTAHAFETFGGLQPCALCLRQREVYWVALSIALVGIALMRLKPSWNIGRGVVALLGLAFLTGTFIAGYHAGVEWHFWPGPTTCSGAGSGLEGLSTSDLSAALGVASKAPACDQIPWSFAGISMAGWNMVLSLFLSAASLFCLLQVNRREIAP